MLISYVFHLLLNFAEAVSCETKDLTILIFLDLSSMRLFSCGHMLKLVQLS